MTDRELCGDALMLALKLGLPILIYKNNPQGIPNAVQIGSGKVYSVFMGEKQKNKLTGSLKINAAWR